MRVYTHDAQPVQCVSPNKKEKVYCYTKNKNTVIFLRFPNNVISTEGDFLAKEICFFPCHYRE